jgi:glycosyltransferase involved in cell wall biosynthesis
MVESVPGVTFKTALPWKELETLFNEVSLFAMPALYEPWGLVYIEALACRTPVLGMNRNALPELTQNGECGFLLNEATPSCVAAKLLEAYSDIPRLATMGYRGQQYVRDRYSWDMTAARIVDALGESDDAEEPGAH